MQDSNRWDWFVQLLAHLKEEWGWDSSNSLNIFLHAILEGSLCPWKLCVFFGEKLAFLLYL